MDLKPQQASTRQANPKAGKDLYGDAYFEGPMAAWHRLSYPTFSRFLRHAVGQNQPQRSLDLGCGTGAYGPLLAELSQQVTGCDGSDSALAKAQATGAYQRLLTIDLNKAPANEWDGPYDLIFTTEVIEHLADEGQVCRRMAEALAPGGRLVVTTTTYHFYVFYYLLYAQKVRARDLFDYLAGYWRNPAADRFVRTLWELTGGHEHGFRARRLLALLTQAGLSIERWRFANVQPLFPVQGLDGERFGRPGRRWLGSVLGHLGREVNEFAAEGDRYGANVLIAARKPG